MLSINDLINQLLNVKKLPTLSPVALMLEQSLSQEEPDVQRVSRIIADDPPVTSMLLRLANSALYGARRTICTVQDAVVRLGFTEIRKMVFDLALVRYMTGMPAGLLDPIIYWRHSISVAFCMEAINDITGVIKKNGSKSHVVGLLHDLGRLVTATYMPEVHVIVPPDATAADPNREIIALEREVIGLDHAQIGAAILERWGLPLEIINCVRYHHEPYVSPRLTRNKVQLLYLADNICKEAEIGDEGEGPPVQLDEEEWEQLGLSSSFKEEIVLKVLEKVKNSEVLLSIGGLSA